MVSKKMEENSLVALTEEYLMSKIYVIRGVQVMLDVDLAVIYGYTTKILIVKLKTILIVSMMILDFNLQI